MPNIKSAEKRVQIASTRNLRNRAERSLLRTNIKKFDSAVTQGSADEAQSAFTVAIKTIDRACSKGILHKNNAARKKSGLAKKLNALNK